MVDGAGGVPSQHGLKTKLPRAQCPDLENGAMNSTRPWQDFPLKVIFNIKECTFPLSHPDPQTGGRRAQAPQQRLSQRSWAGRGEERNPGHMGPGGWGGRSQALSINTPHAAAQLLLLLLLPRSPVAMATVLEQQGSKLWGCFPF